MHDAFSLQELQTLVSDALKQGVPDDCWVRAEISSLSLNGGHCYLELIENRDGKPLARARAIVWNFQYARLRACFMEMTGRELEAGMQVLLQVAVSYHPLYGLSLVVSDIDPSYTLGDEAMRRQQTILRLQQDGVMDMNKEVPIPEVLLRIAVISSMTAAGYGDFCHELDHNEYGYVFATRLFPSLMQGRECASSVVQALDAIAECDEKFDLVVIIRGGGAVTDLSAFDDYRLASYVAQFPLPVWSGVGHTRDISVLDMVAGASWKTPTAVAQAIVAHNRVVEEQIMALRTELADVLEKYIERENNRLAQSALQLPIYAQSWLERQQQRLEGLRQELFHLDPSNMLRKGFAIVQTGKRVITSVSDLNPGQEVEIRLSDGTVRAKIL